MERQPLAAETAVKICGITSAEDAALAEDAGADFVGVIVEVAVSPRSVSRHDAATLLRGVGRGVALLYDASAGLADFLVENAPLAALQLAGSESPETLAQVAEVMECPVWKSVHMSPTSAGEVGLAGAPANAGQAGVEETLAAIDAYVSAGAAGIVLDTVVSTQAETRRGGTGMTHDWEAAARIVTAATVPVILAGGLTPRNVAGAISAVRPACVDVSSGVESAPGVKDPVLVRTFVQAVRRGGL